MGRYSLGIDLGTTNSCAGVWIDGRIKMIPSSYGGNLTPSWVSFSKEHGQLVGEDAAEQAPWNARNSIFHVKKLMGRKLMDAEVQEMLPLLPYKVVEVGGKLKIKTDDKEIFPEEIAAKILSRIKKDAEACLGEEVPDAVITVPAYFNNEQRQATKNAGTIAGLNVLKLLNEPTAAAMAFSMEIERNQTVLVFDLGGGTFDVSILNIREGDIQVQAIAGDCNLGGDTRAIARLQMCESVKKKLSQVFSARVLIDSFFDGEDLNISLSRDRLESLCEDQFQKTIAIVEDAILNANVKKEEIGSILLVGGSTRIPYISNLVTKYFNKAPTKWINPDEAVAYGAAVEASRLMQSCSKVKDMKLMDVTPLSLGTDMVGDEMVVIIPRNSTIPIQNFAIFNNYIDFQTSMEFKVFEGERLKAHENHLLESFVLSGMSPQPKGKSAVKAVFDVDANGILDVTATDLHTGKYTSISIKDIGARLSKDQVKQMIEDGKKFEELDAEFKLKLEARNLFQDYLDSLETITSSTKLTSGKRVAAATSLQEGARWLRLNPTASRSTVLDQLKKLQASTKFN